MSASRIMLGLFVVCLAACGKSNELSDAPTGDANAIDSSSTFDANPRGTVTVTILKRDGTGLPQDNVKVAFIDPDGTVIAEPATDAAGKAHADVLPGASVTVVNPLAPTEHYIDSILGVKPGDDIVIGSADNAGLAGTFSIDVGTPATGTVYTVYGPCGSNYVAGPSPQLGASPGLVTLEMYDFCKQATMDLVVVLEDSNAGTTTSTELKDVAYTNGGSTTVTSAYAPFTTLTASFTNVPDPDVTTISMYEHVPPHANGSYYAFNSTVPTAGAATLAVAVPTATHALINPIFVKATGAHQYLYAQIAGDTTTYPLDVGATLLPWIDTPTLDVATAALTVPLTGTGAVDVMSANVDFTRTDGVGTTAYHWRVWTATAGDLTLPALPADMADNDPKAGDSVYNTRALLGEASAVTSYDQIRAHLDAAFDAYNSGSAIVGTLRVSESPNNVEFWRLRRHSRPTSPPVHAVRDRRL